MPLWFKKDMIATREARRNGTLLCKESYISKPRWVGDPIEQRSQTG